jgi:hypothetical protein
MMDGFFEPRCAGTTAAMMAAGMGSAALSEAMGEALKRAHEVAA